MRHPSARSGAIIQRMTTARDRTGRWWDAWRALWLAVLALAAASGQAAELSLPRPALDASALAVIVNAADPANPSAPEGAPAPADSATLSASATPPSPHAHGHEGHTMMSPASSSSSPAPAHNHAGH